MFDQHSYNLTQSSLFSSHSLLNRFIHHQLGFCHTSKEKGAACPQNPPEGTSGTTEESTASRSENNPKLTEEYPSELRALIEAEERRAAKTAENVKIYTAAINCVENALSPLSKVL